ncbi:MFS transporter [Arcanobacterium phocae]|uniref:MFS transporter n=1 Tax=Arcanobacterium phocae TaxID=131112 RepID=UPI001C0F0485|nr:MFS transporter [Arcanobacterium phocae]
MAPFSPLTYTVREHERPLAVSFLISTVGSATYCLTITYIPTYLESVHNGDSQAALNLGVIAAIAAIAVTLFIALLSDRIGRKHAFALTLAAVVLLAVPGYIMLGLNNTTILIIAIAMLAIPAAAWSAIGAAAIPVATGAFLAWRLATM